MLLGRLSFKVLHVKDVAPDVEELVVGGFEQSPAELAKEDKDEERPDVVEVETEGGKDDDGHVLKQERSVDGKLTFETAMGSLHLLLLLLLGGQGQDQVVHVQVADAIEDTLEDG